MTINSHLQHRHHSNSAKVNSLVAQGLSVNRAENHAADRARKVANRARKVANRAPEAKVANAEVPISVNHTENLANKRSIRQKISLNYSRSTSFFFCPVNQHIANI